MTIAELRKKADKTQAQVAKEAGISWRSYQSIETGAVSLLNAHGHTLRGLAKALNTTIEDLLNAET